jgi:hypothetical protein
MLIKINLKKQNKIQPFIFCLSSKFDYGIEDLDQSGLII